MMNDTTSTHSEKNILLACLNHFNEVNEQLSAVTGNSSQTRWADNVQRRYQASFDLVWRAIERRDAHAFAVRVSETIALIQRTLSDVPDGQTESRLQQWVASTQADFTALCSEEDGSSALARLWGAPRVQLSQTRQLICA